MPEHESLQIVHNLFLGKGNWRHLIWNYLKKSKALMTPDHTIPIRKRPLIILLCARKGPMIIPFPSGSDLWSYHSHPEVTSDHTIPIRKWPLIMQFPSGSDLWSYHSHPEVTSNHTIPIRKWPLIIPFPSAIDPWSDYSHPEPKPRPCNYGLGTHRVRWTSDDQRSLPDGTSTWVANSITWDFKFSKTLYFTLI